MASKKKKITTAIVAGVTALALMLGGTFAWQSINQTALNEVDDTVNPGGRLHDDFNGSNKDVYVENFADDEIFARIRLEEFFEITQAGGTVHSIAGNRIDEDTVEYVLHNFYNENATDAYWNWKTGGSTVFMPTFNKNKDSLVADVNGTYNGLDGIVTNEATDDRYSDYVQYVYGEEKTSDAIYDYDSNSADELGENLNDFSSYPDNVTTVTETHTAKYTSDAKLISMDDWMTMIEENGGAYDANLHGNYWVYDEDGWVYWSAPIKPGEATGLLLDGIGLKEKMDDSWYYAINVIGQFVTKGDVGETDDTGFYDTTDGLSVPTKEAKKLLTIIGAFNEPETVTVTSFTEVSFMDYNEPEAENENGPFYRDESRAIIVSAGETIDIKVDVPGWGELTEVTLINVSTEEAYGAPSTCTDETTLSFDEETQLIKLSVSENELPGTAIYIKVSDGTNIGYIKVLLEEQSYSGDPYYYIYFGENDPLNATVSTDSVDFPRYLEPIVNVFVTPETKSVFMHIKLMNGTPLNRDSVYYDSWNINNMNDSEGNNMVHNSAFQSVLDDGTRRLEIPWKEHDDPERNDGVPFFFYLRASGGKMLAGCVVRVIYVEDVDEMDYSIAASGHAISETLAPGTYPLTLSKVVVNEDNECFTTGATAPDVTWIVTRGNAVIDTDDILTLSGDDYGEIVTLTATFGDKTYEKSFLVGENLVDLTVESDYRFTEGKTYILKTASTETYGIQRDIATLTITYSNGDKETLYANNSGYFVWTPKNVWGVEITDNSAVTYYSVLVRPEKYLEFSSDKHIEIGSNGPYIELQKNRTADTKWNLWGCSEGDFTLSSSNASVTFEPYSEGSDNDDMNIIIPATVTENFTVTATAMNGNGSVTITVVMVDDN